MSFPYEFIIQVIKVLDLRVIGWVLALGRFKGGRTGFGFGFEDDRMGFGFRFDLVKADWEKQKSF